MASAFLHLDYDSELSLYEDLDCYAVIRDEQEQAELDAILCEFDMGESD